MDGEVGVWWMRWVEEVEGESWTFWVGGLGIGMTFLKLSRLMFDVEQAWWWLFGTKLEQERWEQGWIVPS